MLDDRTRSILLQVAFKEASSQLTDTTEVRGLTVEFFNILVELHEELGINPTNSNSGSRSGRSRSTTTSAPAPQGETFIFNGVLVEDFRKVKADPSQNLKPNYPDFKTVKGEEIEGVTTPRGAAWLYTQEGEPVESTKVLVQAADSREF